MYIIIEGQDGTGKSTQVELLAEYLRKQGKKVVTVHEPDGDLEQAHIIHDLIVDNEKGYNLESLTNVALFTAARLELWHKTIEPILKDGGYAISARNWWSTLAYQGYGEGVSRHKIIQITKSLLPKHYFTPDKAVILTVSDETRLKRQEHRGKNTETFEAKPDDFQQKVNHAYLKIAQQFNIPTIDATSDIDQIQLTLREVLFDDNLILK